MKNYIYKSNERTLYCSLNDEMDFVTSYNEQGIAYKHLGQIIRQLGSIESLLTKCEETTLSLDEWVSSIKEAKISAKKEREMKLKSRDIETYKKICDEFNKVKGEDGIIEMTLDNLSIVGSYIQGLHIYPSLIDIKMSENFEAQRVDCEGNMAVVLFLERELEGEQTYVVGAPNGYLIEYARLRSKFGNVHPKNL